MANSLASYSQLIQWAEANKPQEDLIYSGGFGEQISFVHQTVPHILSKNIEEYKAIQANLKAISSHTSKSLNLPVFRVELADGTAFTMRNNFHNWKVSVESPRDVKADFIGLFDPYEKIHQCYCEGFGSSLVYGSYAENKRRFTIGLPPDNNYLFMFFWIFAHKVLGKKTKY